jgi:hypothetical protein
MAMLNNQMVKHHGIWFNLSPSPSVSGPFLWGFGDAQLQVLQKDLPSAAALVYTLVI